MSKRTQSIASVPLEEFLAALAAKTPTPAGGSAAALVGSQAAALVSLVIRFTLGKPKYAAVEAEMARYLIQSEALRETLLRLADEDIAAYADVAATFAMPKNTPEARRARTSALQSALKRATVTPFAVAEQCLAVIRLIEPVGSQGNPTVVSDGATALYLAHGALRSALLNVRVNLQAIKDPDFTAEWAARADVLEEAVGATYANAQLACEATLAMGL